MNVDLEKIFCDTFIEKSLRDRIFWELSSPKRRSIAIGRFSDSHMIKASTIVLYGKKLTKEDILNEVRKFSNSKTGYIIAFPDELDGKEFPLETAIDKFFYLGTGAVIIVDSKTAILKCEQECGPSRKYVVHAK